MEKFVTTMWALFCLFSGMSAFLFIALKDPKGKEYLHTSVDFVCTLFAQWFFFL